MKNDEIGELSKTVVKYGPPGGKFHFKHFDEIALKDLDWLVEQTWVHGEIKRKLITYLSKPLIQRALEKELNS